MSAGKINFHYHTATQSMELKKDSKSFLFQRKKTDNSQCLNKHLNNFTHNLKWWHFQILLLAEALPTVGLEFLVGEYKYSTTETYPLVRAPHEDCDPHQYPLTFQTVLQSQCWPSAVKKAFSSTWIGIFLPFETGLLLHMKYFSSACHWGSHGQPWHNTLQVWSLAHDHYLHGTRFSVVQHSK